MSDTFQGFPPTVGIQRKYMSPLAQKAKELLLGRTVVGVFMEDDQLVLRLDDGATFTMSADGGFKESQ